MSIAARCGDCHKLYKVDDKLAGKRVRCKACGGTVAIPAAAPAVEERVPSARTSSAAAPRKQAARPAPVQDDDPFNNLDAFMSLEGSGTVQEEPAPVFKPSRKQRSEAAAIEPAPYTPAPLRAPALQYATPQRRATGGNSDAVAFLLDKIIPGIIIAIGWGLPFILMIVGIFNSPVPGKALLAVVIQQALLFFVMVPTIAAGVQIAANNARFDMTENPKFKIFAILTSFWLVGLATFIFLLIAGSAAARNGSLSSIGVSSALSFGLGVIFIVFLVCTGAGYIQFKLYFHCTWVQALVGFLMYFLFTILGAIGCFGALFLLGLVIGSVNKAIN